MAKLSDCLTVHFLSHRTVFPLLCVVPHPSNNSDNAVILIEMMAKATKIKCFLKC